MPRPWSLLERILTHVERIMLGWGMPGVARDRWNL